MSPYFERFITTDKAKFTLGGKDATKDGSLAESVVPATRTGTKEVSCLNLLESSLNDGEQFSN